MPLPLSIQLYTLREALKDDFTGIVTRLAEIGYVGVEPYHGMPATPQDAARLFRQLGLDCPSAHARLPLGEGENGILEAASAFGLEYIIAGIPPDEFKTLDDIRRGCDRFNQAQIIAARSGFKIGYHNHWWEFEKVEGRYGYHVMLEELDPAIIFQIDTYWVKTAGLDPAEVIHEMGARVPLLHIKDGPATQSDPMVAVGDGSLDFPKIIAAGKHVQWLVVELDRCATDMLAAVEKSYRYLTEKGLGRGSKG